MTIAVLIGTYGEDSWRDLALARALPSALSQGADEVLDRHEKEGTISSVRNALAEDAESDWLCFLDADDELDPGYLAAMERETNRRDMRWRLLVPAVSYVHRAGEYGLAEIPNGGGRRPLVDINHAVIGTLVPRRLFLAVGGFRDLPALEDWDLWLRCEEAGAKLVPVPDAVYRAWMRPDSRNKDQSLYYRLRDEALARRALRAKGERDDHDE